MCKSRENNWNVKGLYTENLNHFFEDDDFSLIYSDEFKVNHLLYKKSIIEKAKPYKSLGMINLIDHYILYNNFYDEFINLNLIQNHVCKIKVSESVYHPGLLQMSLKLFKNKMIIFTKKCLETK